LVVPGKKKKGEILGGKKGLERGTLKKADPFDQRINWKKKGKILKWKKGPRWRKNNRRGGVSRQIESRPKKTRGQKKKRSKKVKDLGQTDSSITEKKGKGETQIRRPKLRGPSVREA